MAAPPHHAGARGDRALRAAMPEVVFVRQAPIDSTLRPPPKVVELVQVLSRPQRLLRRRDANLSRMP